MINTNNYQLDTLISLMSEAPLDHKKPGIWLKLREVSLEVVPDKVSFELFLRRVTAPFLLHYASSLADPVQEALFLRLPHKTRNEWISLLPPEKSWMDIIGFKGLKFIFTKDTHPECQLKCYVAMDPFMRKEILTHILKTHPAPDELFLDWIRLSPRYPSFGIDFAPLLIDLKLPRFARDLKEKAWRFSLDDTLLPLDEDLSDKEVLFQKALTQFKTIQDPTVRTYLVPLIKEREGWPLLLFQNLAPYQWPLISTYFKELQDPLPHEVILYITAKLERFVKLVDAAKVYEKILPLLPHFPSIFSYAMEKAKGGRLAFMAKLIARVKPDKRSFLWKPPFLKDARERAALKH